MNLQFHHSWGRFAFFLLVLLITALLAACAALPATPGIAPAQDTPTTPAVVPVTQAPGPTPEIITVEPAQSITLPAVTGTPETGNSFGPEIHSDQVTRENNRQVITLQPGQRFTLLLGEGYDWNVIVANEAIASRVVNITPIKGSQGVFEAHQPGTTTLTANGDPACRKLQPACASPSIMFEIQIQVEAAAKTPGKIAQGVPPITQLRMFTAQSGWGINSPTGQLYRSTQGGSAWEEVTPSDLAPTKPDAGYLRSAYFLNDNSAWLSSADVIQDTNGTVSTTITLYSTKDAGQTWKTGGTIKTSGYGPGELFFLDDQNGWLSESLGAAAGSVAVELYATKDGGQTWNQLMLTSGYEGKSSTGALPFSCDKNGFSFATPLVGWAAGSCPGGELFFFSTKDGGKTWTRFAPPAPAGAPADTYKQCVCSSSAPQFVSASGGFFTISIFDPITGAFLYSTTDGGKTWTPHKLPIDALPSAPVLVDAKTMYLPSGTDLYLSQDAGVTWTKAGTLPTDNYYTNSVTFPTVSDGWLSDGTQLYATHDGGKTWAPLP